jgi:hypothetical protein
MVRSYPGPLLSFERAVGFFECLPLEQSHNCENESEDSDVSKMPEWTEKVAEKRL